MKFFAIFAIFCFLFCSSCVVLNATELEKDDSELDASKSDSKSSQLERIDLEESFKEMRAKLDKTLSKTTSILHDLNDLSFGVECHTTKDLYLDLSHLLRHLALTFHQHMQDVENKEGRKLIQKGCISESQGINKIYTSFTFLLEKKSVNELFRNCFHYDLTKINHWKKKINDFLITFIDLAKNCEKSLLPADFYYIGFSTRVNELIEYYTEQMLMENFVKDEKSGVTNFIERIINEDKSAEETAKNLGKKFEFFKWNVILFKKDYLVDHVYYSQNETDLCGSILFINSSNLDKNALVAWCVADSFDNSKLNVITFKEDIRDVLEDIKSHNPNLNYALVIKKESRRFFSRLYRADTYGAINERYYKTDYIRRLYNYIYASDIGWLSFRNDLKKRDFPKFEDQAFIFHKGKNFKVTK